MDLLKGKRLPKKGIANPKNCIAIIKNKMNISDKRSKNKSYRHNQEELQFMEKISQFYDNTMNENNKINKYERIEFIFEKINTENLNKDEKQFVRKICETFPYQYYLEGDSLSSTDVIKHKITLIPNAKPVNMRQYRIPQTHKKPLEDIIQDYEKQGIIEKCQSNFNSPAILVPKRDESGGKTDFRFVIDYKKLNEITEIQNFPIPLIDDILNGLSGCFYFTTLDIKNAFSQILMEESSKDYTAFTVSNFQYRWCRMPQGLAASPFTWQRAINTILADYIGHGVYVYLDDIIVYAKTKTEHDNIMWQIMKLLKKNNLQLKISKCSNIWVTLSLKRVSGQTRRKWKP